MTTTSTTTVGWRKFLLVLTPLALVAVAVALEVAGAGLRAVAPNRNYLDYLAAAARSDPANARIVIFGDSVTKEVLKVFRLGPPERIADLTTHGGAGLPSMALLLRRYLASHVAPNHVVLALAPDAFVKPPLAQNAKEWLTSVFTDADEQAWLGRFYPDLVRAGWRPVAADLQARVFDRLTGLLAPGRRTIPMGPNLPAETVAVEPPEPASAFGEASARERMAVPLEMSPIARAALTDICGQARAKDIAVHLVRAPVPADVYARWREGGRLDRLDADVDALLAKECGPVDRFDAHARLEAPNFDGFALHLVGFGWQNRYALTLQRYLDQIDPP